jgi:hypothetical protein
MIDLKKTNLELRAGAKKPGYSHPKLTTGRGEMSKKLARARAAKSLKALEAEKPITPAKPEPKPIKMGAKPQPGKPWTYK